MGGYDELVSYDLILLAIAVYAVAVIVTLIYEERDPSTTLAWILVLLLVPVLGVGLYLLFGRDLRRSGARDRRRQEATALAAEALREVRGCYRFADTETAADPLFAGVSRAIERFNGTTALPCVDLQIFSTGDEKFARLLEDIEGAKRFVHLQYFIWESDDLTQQVCDLLARKVHEGVEVRVLYDWIGSAPYGKKQLKALRAAGAQVRPDRADWRKLNFRNHRKTVVIDGRIAYTGGMNMGREYADGGRRFDVWRDTHVRFEGPLVHDVHALYCSRWYRVTGESLFDAERFPEPEPLPESGWVWAQLAFSGPESQWQALRHVLLFAISHANASVRVQSPYYVPDQTIADALAASAFAGIDVKLMMAGVHDKRLPWWAAFSYLDELVAAGATVLQYEAGFLHAKAVTVDGRLASIGTTNFDYRSFALHDELQLFFYDAAIARRQEALFDADSLCCRELTGEVLARIGPLARFRNAVARLFSRAL
ncbi:MAG: cardiolipin synthase [Coriobacteriia bacterium]|nr:cardiolipin synthase [Coriobacteriia bacterium]